MRFIASEEAAAAVREVKVAWLPGADAAGAPLGAGGALCR